MPYSSNRSLRLSTVWGREGGEDTDLKILFLCGRGLKNIPQEGAGDTGLGNSKERTGWKGRKSWGKKSIQNPKSLGFSTAWYRRTDQLTTSPSPTLCWAFWDTHGSSKRNILYLYHSVSCVGLGGSGTETLGQAVLEGIAASVPESLCKLEKSTFFMHCQANWKSCLYWMN